MKMLHSKMADWIEHLEDEPTKLKKPPPTRVTCRNRCHGVRRSTASPPSAARSEGAHWACQS